LGGGGLVAIRSLAYWRGGEHGMLEDLYGMVKVGELCSLGDEVV